MKHFNFSGSFGFDVCLFLGLTLLNITAVVIKSFVTNEAIIDDSDLKHLALSRLITAIIVVPFFEEFVFRGYLCLEKKIYVVLFTIALLFLVCVFFNSNKFIIACVLIFSFLMLFCSSVNTMVVGYINTHLLVFIIISSILFGVMHFTNYDKFEYVNLLIIVPKILVGVFLSYITLKYNIFLAYAFHGINNFIPFIMIYFYSIK